MIVVYIPNPEQNFGVISQIYFLVLLIKLPIIVAHFSQNYLSGRYIIYLKKIHSLTDA
jgi:hypothetical protein